MAVSYRKPHSYKIKKSILKNRFFWFGFLILIFISAIFYFLFFSQTFQIEKIIVTGENKVSTEDIKSLIQPKLENKILFFKTKSILLVNLDEIKEDILANFPPIAEVEIKKGFPDAINVLIIERAGLALWCQAGQCFLVDNEGVVFERIFEETELVKIINEENQGPVLLGEKVIEKEKLNQVLFKIAPELEINLKITFKDFVISAEDKLIVETEEGWEIYFNFRNDIDWQMTKLRADLEEKIPPEKRKDLEYIDVQFGNFAPYKYRR